MGNWPRSAKLTTVVMSVLVVALLAAVVVIGASDDGTSEQASRPAATAPTTTAPAQPATPAASGDGGKQSDDIYGWGSGQPTLMRATVRWGASSKPMTRERRALLASQLVHVREVALKIGTVAEAERLGFKKNFQRLNGRGYEYINFSNFTDHLDLDKPGVLAFEDDKPDSRIVSVAYNVLGTIEGGPPKDLPLEVIPWHFHSNLCRKGTSIVGSVELDPSGKPYQDQIDRCKELGATFEPQLDHWMVDLWVVPGWENPWGLVSAKHPDLMFQPTPWFNATNNAGAEAEGDHQHNGDQPS